MPEICEISLNFGIDAKKTFFPMRLLNAKLPTEYWPTYQIIVSLESPVSIVATHFIENLAKSYIFITLIYNVLPITYFRGWYKLISLKT